MILPWLVVELEYFQDLGPRAPQKEKEKKGQPAPRYTD